MELVNYKPLTDNEWLETLKRGFRSDEADKYDTRYVLWCDINSNHDINDTYEKLKSAYNASPEKAMVELRNFELLDRLMTNPKHQAWYSTYNLEACRRYGSFRSMFETFRSDYNNFMSDTNNRRFLDK
jgi:hypothetical protein